MKRFMSEVMYRGDYNGGVHDALFAKYGTQVLEGVRMIAGLSDDKKLGIEALRLRAEEMAARNLENLEIPEIRNDVGLARYDEGYNDALADLLDAFGIAHGISRFED